MPKIRKAKNNYALIKIKFRNITRKHDVIQIHKRVRGESKEQKLTRRTKIDQKSFRKRRRLLEDYTGSEINTNELYMTIKPF